MSKLNQILLHKRLPLVGLILSLTLFFLSMTGNNTLSHTDRAAKRMQTRIENRLEILDIYITQALSVESDEDILQMNIPDDMVIYRYVNDSLRSWCNQFMITNDDITTKHIFQKLTDRKRSRISPLTDIGEHVSFENLGSKWYLVKKVQGPNYETIIAGLYIKNTIIDDLKKTENGVNPHLMLPRKYAVLQLNHSGGRPIVIDGMPLFKVIQSPSQATVMFDNTILRWFSLMFMAFAIVLFLARHRNFKIYWISVATLLILAITAIIWALKMQGSSEMLSPSLYADDGLLFSLGTLLTFNTLITALSICAYIIKGRIKDWIRGNPSYAKRKAAAITASTGIIVVLLIYYIHISLQSLILNSSIPLELYKMGDNLTYSIIIYLSYIFLIIGILLLLQQLRPAVYLLAGHSYNLFSPIGIFFFCGIASLYITINVGVSGLNKETDVLEVLANKITVERNMGLEIQLRQIEDEIAKDPQIALLASRPENLPLISTRISEYYLSRLKQSHRIKVETFYQNDTQKTALNNVLRNGIPIIKNSRFLFMFNDNGQPYYSGVFMYYSRKAGTVNLLVNIEPISSQEDKGYYSILGKFSRSSKLNIPSIYSYAKYKNGKLVSYKGDFPYPTASGAIDNKDAQSTNSIVKDKTHIHFTHNTSEDEQIIISRPVRGPVVFFTSFSYLFIVMLVICHFITRKKLNSSEQKSAYFKRKINTIISASSAIILISIITVSVIFFYQRNEANMTDLMSQKISTSQSLTETQMMHAKDWHDLTTQEFRTDVENISNTTKSDITLYTPEGKVFYSTTPEVFEKMLLGSRMDNDAYYNIFHRHQRFYIHKENLEGYQFWSLYAPLFNEAGKFIAIISVPYTGKSYDVRRESFLHISLIICLFIMLLICALIFSSREVSTLFTPLIEMGKKMSEAEIDNLEYIIYKREDELSSLVDAYNRMVRDLSESTILLAQAERDKAWSQMARQVAHEIKNPLTPIKLEIQRLIRLKKKNNPAWEEKFDKVAAVILEHIDILTDTANEFSTFAKLYSEDPVVIDLDKTLKDQLLIFDNKENIKISYIGMENAFVMAPKPQLIRVFVNLITNAIQAVEMQQKELSDKGEDSRQGRVLICLRNSIRNGYYDIVVDDSGSGVKEENLSKLFTPNFTTKNSGTGLGLAICRNIVEKCNGEISYQKSFALGGASFTVTLPQHKD